MTRPITKNRKGLPQTSNQSFRKPGEPLQPRESPVVVSAIQSNHISSVPEPDSTRQLADTTDLSLPRRSARIAQVKEKRAQDLEVQQSQNSKPKEPKTPKATRGHKRKLDSTAPTNGHRAKQVRITQPEPQHSQPRQQESVHVYRDASTQTSETKRPPSPKIHPLYQDASTQIFESKRPQNSKIQPWLETLAPQEPPESQQNLQQLYAMPASAGGQAPTPSTLVDASTSKKSSKTPATRTKQLLAHKSSLKPTLDKDDLTIKLEGIMKQKKKLSKTQMNKLMSILLHCLEEDQRISEDDERYEVFDSFRNSLNEALPACQLSTLTTRNLEIVRKRCMESQEALLQRTILYNSADIWQIEDYFIVDGEDQWKVAPEYLLRDTKEFIQPKKVSGVNPVPDLAIFYSIDKICAPDSKERQVFSVIDSKLRTCIHPDDKSYRCFPFLFMEAKRSDHSIHPALLDSTYEANQALQNIFSCMEKAGTTEDLGQVRVFSIGMNAEKLEVRVHYAKLNSLVNTLYFYFYVAEPGSIPLGDNLHRVIRSILRDYASNKLLPILQNTFRKLTHAVAMEKYGREKTLEYFGADFLEGFPVEDAGNLQETTEPAVDADALPEQTSNAQKRKETEGQQPPENQQGEGQSKKARPDSTPNAGPSSVNTEAGESFGVSNLGV